MPLKVVSVLMNSDRVVTSGGIATTSEFPMNKLLEFHLDSRHCSSSEVLFIVVV